LRGSFGVARFHGELLTRRKRIDAIGTCKGFNSIHSWNRELSKPKKKQNMQTEDRIDF
jgi:hypothetical protein